MKSLFQIAGILLVILLATPIDSYAGGCSGGGGRGGAPVGESPAETKRRQAMEYELGKRILEGKERLRPLVVVLAKQQGEALNEFKRRAPHERIDDVVGRLSKDQFSAVKHYLKTRYSANQMSAEEIRVAQFQKSKTFLEK